MITSLSIKNFAFNRSTTIDFTKDYLSLQVKLELVVYNSFGALGLVLGKERLVSKKTRRKKNVLSKAFRDF